ncbi:MAG TPA: hypothetical protein VND90_00205 [Terracidiphilus sp.]|nr:hypothetical protein [Terracidiphilus sp.]
MSLSILDALGAFATMAPFLAILGILVYYFARRAVLRRNLRKGKRPSGSYPSTFALGMAFQLLQVYYRPAVSYEVQVRLVEKEEDDDEGDPESPIKHLHRQLKRIRRGQPVDNLVVRI